MGAMGGTMEGENTIRTQESLEAHDQEEEIADEQAEEIAEQEIERSDPMLTSSSGSTEQGTPAPQPTVHDMMDLFLHSARTLRDARSIREIRHALSLFRKANDIHRSLREKKTPTA